MQPAPRSIGSTKHTIQLSALVLGFAVLLDIAFVVLSAVYFADKRTSILAVSYDDAHILHVRIAFAIFSAIVATGVIAALFAPKWIGHGIPVVASVAALAAAWTAFGKGMPAVLPAALGVAGLVFPALVWRSLARSRVAWSFLIAMCFALALVLLFGAPKVGNQAGVNLWTAMIIPGLLTVAGVALIMVRRDYRDV